MLTVLDVDGLLSTNGAYIGKDLIVENGLVSAMAMLSFTTCYYIVSIFLKYETIKLYLR